ncbi:hypothetical protein HBA53_25280 (plasmid) [Rhodococcus pyridinivorans]|uniref:hypothetical protein n=1 Tax=Rhodococcus pyridinivorans TaxID=103816 RepID=UPI001C2FA54B|nr:hypothetical protein [Rhodococcus pyridinivorans]QXF84408.1 hypothetical protein HBA53_25280 [Rhodococcus pyridinivorans]
MSTDNRGALFPDVTEHYGPQPTPIEEIDTGSVHFPIPDETIADAAVADSDLEPVAAETTWESDDDDAVIQTDLEPIGAAETPVVDTAPAPIPQDPDGAAPHPDTQAGDDPYATAPDWVRAHIPRGPLVISQRSRGGLKSAIGRARSPRPAPAPVPESVEVVTGIPAAPVTDTAAAPVKPGGDRSRTWMLVGGGVAVLAVVCAAVVTAMAGSTDEPLVPPLPSPSSSVVASSAITPSPTATAAPSWCAPVDEPGRIVGNGPGGRDSGPAVIQAFEHAYYVQRDGKVVADLMVLPGDDIQNHIDAVPVGTEHCVTVLPTEDPNRWSVDVLLKFPPVGDEGIHKQWITTMTVDGGMKIANVENR